jgi:hypothetical protein
MHSGLTAKRRDPSDAPLLAAGYSINEQIDDDRLATLSG